MPFIMMRRPLRLYAQAIKTFDLVAFANQLWRAQWVWLVQVASLLNIKIPAESLGAGGRASLSI